MTKIIGKPNWGGPLKMLIRESVPYRTAELGVSQGIHEGTWNGTDWGINLVMPRYAQPDAIAQGGVSIFISRSDSGAVVAKYDYAPEEWIETNEGEFDLGRGSAARAWVRTQSLSNLLAACASATQDALKAAAAANASGHGGGGGGGSGPASSEPYAPTYETPVTITNTLAVPTNAQVLLTLKTTHADPSGADIRVFSGGLPVPHLVTSVDAMEGYMQYHIAFRDSLAAKEQKTYVIKYGDPDAGYMSLTQKQLWRIAREVSATASQATLGVDRDAGILMPGDFNSLGTTILFPPGLDDSVQAFNLPADTSVVFNGATYTSYSISGNWGFQFTETGNTTSNPTASNNGFYLSGGFDWHVYRVGFEVTSDGLAWYITHAQHGYQEDVTRQCFTTIKYINGGKWIMSTQKAFAPTPPYRQQIRAGGVGITFSVPDFTATQASECVAAVVEPMALISQTWGDEGAIAQ